MAKLAFPRWFVSSRQDYYGYLIGHHLMSIIFRNINVFRIVSRLEITQIR